MQVQVLLLALLPCVSAFVPGVRVPAATRQVRPYAMTELQLAVSELQTTWEMEIAQLKKTEMQEHGDEVQHGSDTETNTPFLIIEGSKAKVTVGKGTEANPFHPMTGEHYITHVYVEDQNGKPVAMQYPKGGKKAEMSFDIPEGTTKLRAFEHCSKDGLWEGPEVKVPAKEAGPARLLSRIAEPGLVLV